MKDEQPEIQLKKSEVTEQTVLQCAECEEELYKCDDCGEPFIVGGVVFCDYGNSLNHYCDNCTKDPEEKGEGR